MLHTALYIVVHYKLSVTVILTAVILMQVVVITMYHFRLVTGLKKSGRKCE